MDQKQKRGVTRPELRVKEALLLSNGFNRNQIDTYYLIKAVIEKDDYRRRKQAHRGRA